MIKDWDVPFFDESIFEEEKEPQKRKVYTVSELTEEIRNILEDSYPVVWVEGEISNFKVHHEIKHLYFTLKDSNSQIDAIMFSSYAQSLKFKPENGLLVLVRGKISFYPPQGRTQIIVFEMEPKGQGALFLALHQLKLKLKKEGLFDEKHKKPLPLLPQKIGIVTSPTGAAIRDILKVIKQRQPNLEILIYPSRVQGEEAPYELIEGINYFNTNNNVDVIILTRGGGSIEDLWAFNDENLARVIFNSKIPIISAVGHEIDVSISDLVADLRAPTPTAAAQIVVKKKDELKEYINNLNDKLITQIQLRFQKYHNALIKLCKHKSFQGFPYKIYYLIQLLSELRLKLSFNLKENLVKKKNKLNSIKSKLNLPLIISSIEKQRKHLENMKLQMDQSVKNLIRKKSEAVSMMSGKLSVLNPFGILKRGYSICYDNQNKIIKDASEVQLNEEISIQLYKGFLKSIVREVKNDK